MWQLVCWGRQLPASGQRRYDWGRCGGWRLSRGSGSRRRRRGGGERTSNAHLKGMEGERDNIMRGCSDNVWTCHCDCCHCCNMNDWVSQGNGSNMNDRVTRGTKQCMLITCGNGGSTSLHYTEIHLHAYQPLHSHDGTTAWHCSRQFIHVRQCDLISCCLMSRHRTSSALLPTCR